MGTRGWYSGGHYAPGETGLILGNFSGYHWGSNVASKQATDSITAHTRVARALGKAYVGSIGLAGPGDAASQTYAARFLHESDRLIDLDGRVITRSAISTDDPAGWPFYSILSANYTAYLKDAMRRAVEAGLDGIVIDDEGYMQWMGISANPQLIDEFRLRLAVSSSPQELATRYAITDLATHDLLAHLRREAAPGVDERPLLTTYRAFLEDITIEKLVELRDYAKALAREEGRTFHFSGNTAMMYSSWFRFVAEYDSFTGEWFHGRGDYKRAPDMDKLIEAAMPGMGAHLLVEFEIRDTPMPGNTSAFVEAIAADAFATSRTSPITGGNEALVLRNDLYVRAPTFDWRVIDKWGGVVRSHPEVFAGLSSPHDAVGLLYSLTSSIPEGASEIGYWGASELLADAGIPYDAIFLGDAARAVAPTHLDPLVLATHRSIVVPRVVRISDEDVSALLTYAREGGTLILLDVFALRDVSGVARARPELDALRVPGEHAYGAGRVVSVEANMGTQYHTDADARFRSGSPEILAAFERVVVPLLRVAPLQDLPERVGLASYQNANASVQFLVSYRTNVVGLVEAAPVEMAVRVPEGRSAWALLDGMDPMIPVVEGQRISFRSQAALYFPRDGTPPPVSPPSPPARERLLFDEAHGDPFSLTWDGALAKHPSDPLGSVMRAYGAYLASRFELTVKTSGEIAPEDLAGVKILLLDSPQRLAAAERDVLRGFVSSGGRVLVTYGAGPCPDDLNAFLDEHGMRFSCEGSPKVSPMRDYWWDIFNVSDFPEFAIGPQRTAGPRIVDVTAPAIPLMWTPGDVYQDKDHDNAADEAERRGPFALAAVDRDATSGGMVIAYGDHTSQDIAFDEGHSFQLQVALLDLAAYHG